MPGFRVGFETPNPELPSADINFYYSYTWEIPEILGDSSRSQKLIALKECSTPTFTANKESYTASSLEYKYAKSIVWDDIRVSWYDSEGLLAKIREWRQTVWSPEYGLKAAKNYKKNTRLSYYLPDYTSSVGWVLKNSWPSTIRSGDLTYTNSDVKVIEVIVTYDWAEEFSQ